MSKRTRRLVMGLISGVLGTAAIMLPLSAIGASGTRTTSASESAAGTVAEGICQSLRRI
jgi:hypothetical protein